MALTISQKPQAYTPAYNNQYIVALSTLYATTGFSYGVKVTVNGGTPLVYDILPRPDGYLVFNAMEAVKNYIERNFDPTSISFIEAVNKSVDVSIDIIENGVSPFATSTITYRAFDACLKESVFSAYNYQNYVSGQTFGVSFLSPTQNEMLYPDNRVSLNTDIWLHFYLSVVDDILFSIYDSNNVLRSTFTLPVKASPIVGTNIFYVNVGPQQLIGNGKTVLDGYGIEYDIRDGVNSLYSGSYSIADICTKHVPYIVYYLKRNGQIGYYHFELKSEETANKKTNEVKLNGASLVAGVYSKSIYKRERHSVNTEITRTIILNSNWITQGQSDQLDELFDSPIVWVKNNSGDYLPVTITDNSYTYRKHVNDNLFNYTITCEYSQTEKRQRGI